MLSRAFAHTLQQSQTDEKPQGRENICSPLPPHFLPGPSPTSNFLSSLCSFCPFPLSLCSHPSNHPSVLLSHTLHPAGLSGWDAGKLQGEINNGEADRNSNGLPVSICSGALPLPSVMRPPPETRRWMDGVRGREREGDGRRSCGKHRTCTGRVKKRGQNRKIQCRVGSYAQKIKELIEECGWKEWEHREDKIQGGMVYSARPAHVAECSAVPVYSHLSSLGSAVGWKQA